VAIVDRCERRDRVDEEQRGVTGAVDGGTHVGDAAGDPGRGLVVHDRDGFDRVRAIVAQPRRDRVGVDAVPPVARDHLDFQAEPACELAPQRGELPGLDHQHAIARRERVDQRRLPRAGSGSGVDHDRTRGREDRLDLLGDLERQRREARPAMVDRRAIDGAQHAFRGTLVGPGICRKWIPLT